MFQGLLTAFGNDRRLPAGRHTASRTGSQSVSTPWIRMPQNSFGTLQSFDAGHGRRAQFHSLPHLEKSGLAPVSKLPVSIRIVLEAVLRHCDGVRVTDKDVRALAAWQPQAERRTEIPFVVSRILL